MRGCSPLCERTKRMGRVRDGQQWTDCRSNVSDRSTVQSGCMLLKMCIRDRGEAAFEQTAERRAAGLGVVQLAEQRVGYVERFLHAVCQ